MTNKKCPKCGSRTFEIIEFTVFDLHYEVEDGVVIPAGMGDVGERLSNKCICADCGHVWHPRNFDYTIDA